MNNKNIEILFESYCIAKLNPFEVFDKFEGFNESEVYLFQFCYNKISKNTIFKVFHNNLYPYEIFSYNDFEIFTPYEFNKCFIKINKYTDLLTYDFSPGSIFKCFA